MQTVGSLILKYLAQKKIVPNQLAESSGVSRQRLGEIIRKNRCPAEHNFQLLLEAMDLDVTLKKALIDAYQMQRKQIIDRKLKTGENMREDALMKKILEHYGIRIIHFFDHLPCTKGVECNPTAGLNSILNCLDKNDRKHLLHYQKTREELQEYYDEVEKKSGMEMETFASTYRTRMDIFITFFPINGDDKSKLCWIIDSVFDGLVVNRSGFPFEKILWDLPIEWEDNRYAFGRKRKGHKVRIRSSIRSETKKPEKDDEFFKTLRSINIPQGKTTRQLSSYEVYKAISKKLEAECLEITGVKRKDTVPVNRGDIYELCDCLHQALANQRAKKENPKGLKFQLQLLLSKFRQAPMSAQFEAIMLHWASRYFDDLAQKTRSKDG